jgi:hypothetical protein
MQNKGETAVGRQNEAKRQIANNKYLKTSDSYQDVS